MWGYSTRQFFITLQTKMITIREEQYQDIHAIRDVNIQAFGQDQEADLIDKIH